MNRPYSDLIDSVMKRHARDVIEETTRETIREFQSIGIDPRSEHLKKIMDNRRWDEMTRLAITE